MTRDAFKDAVAKLKAETREMIARFRRTRLAMVRAEGQTRACLWCAKAVHSVGRGRPALYCSKECRAKGRTVYQTAYRRRYRAEGRDRGMM